MFIKSLYVCYYKVHKTVNQHSIELILIAIATHFKMPVIWKFSFSTDFIFSDTSSYDLSHIWLLGKDKGIHVWSGFLLIYNDMVTMKVTACRRNHQFNMDFKPSQSPSILYITKIFDHDKG